MTDTENRVRQVLVRVLTEADPAAMTAGADLVTDLGMDSLQMISFLLAVEDEFGLELDYDNLELGDLRSVRQFATYLTGLRVEAQA
jgi:acyl carrier protein